MNFTSSITLFFKDAFSSGFTQAQNSLAGMKGALGKINENQSMNRLAADLAMASAMTDPFRQKLSALMDEPSKLAGSFESSLKNIQAITGMTAAEIGVLEGQLSQIGGKHAAGPLAVADAYSDVAGGITNVAAQLPTLDAALLLAEAGQADLGVATNGLVKILNSYNFSAGDAASVTEKAAWASDVMTQAVGMGVGSMQEFVSAMAPISGAAASVGVGFDEIGSTMAYMTATTDTAATAGTKLESFMTALQKPSDMLREALASVGIESGSAMLKQYGLAESARIVSDVFGGSSDLITQALGRQEAKAAVISLMGSQYTQFASEFGAAMQSSVTAEAAAVQNQSYEAKLGRMNAAMDALKVQTGDNINAIKGFFVDIGTGFLTHVVSPIMSSPVGGVFQGMAAGAGMLAKGLLDVGGGALNAAAQLAVLTSTIQNMGGFMALFKNSLSLLRAPFIMIGGLALKAIPSIVAFGASLWTALAPVLPFVAAAAALAVGGYLLIKHWDAVSTFFVNLWNKVTGAFSAAFNWIREKLAGVSNWVLGAVAAFMPFIGIPLLIIKNWDTIKAFFAGLWVQVKAVFVSAWNSIVEFFGSVWNSIVGTAVAAWNGLSSFFVSVWNGITGIVASVANWFGGVWNTITGAFAAAWMWVKDLFFGVWESIKGVVLGFVEWLSPVIDVIIAPFKAIGNVIGGIVGAVKGWFGDTVETGKTELAKTAGSRAVAANVPAAVKAAPEVSANTLAPKSPAIASPVLTATTTSAVSVPVTTPTMPTGEVSLPVNSAAIEPVSAVSAPVTTSSMPSGEASRPVSSAAIEPVSAGTTTASSGGASLAAEHLAAASRKGIAGQEIGSFASDAFMSAGTSAASPGIDLADYENEARVTFAEAARPAQRESVSAPLNRNEERAGKKERPSFSVQNLYLQADDIEKVFDLYRQLEMIFANPTEVAV